jgi:hypothetical protein
MKKLEQFGSLRINQPANLVEDGPKKMNRIPYFIQFAC